MKRKEIHIKNKEDFLKEYNRIVCDDGVKVLPYSKTKTNEIIDIPSDEISICEDRLNYGETTDIETEYTYWSGYKVFIDFTTFKSCEVVEVEFE